MCCSFRVFADDSYSISVQAQEGALTNVYSLCRVADQSGSLLYRENFDWNKVKEHYGWTSSEMTDLMLFQALKSKLSPATVESSDIGFLSRCVLNTSGTVKNDNVAISVDDGSYVLISETAIPLICGVGTENPNIVLAEKIDIPINDLNVEGFDQKFEASAFLSLDRIAHCKCSTIIPTTFFQFQSFPLVFNISHDQSLIYTKNSVKLTLDNNDDITSFAKIDILENGVVVSFDDLRDKNIELFNKIKDGSVIDLSCDFNADPKSGAGANSPSISSKLTYPLSPTSTKTSDTVEIKIQCGLLKFNICSIDKNSHLGISGIGFMLENSEGQFLNNQGVFVEQSQASIFTTDSIGLASIDFALGCDKYTLHQTNYPEGLVPSSDKTTVDLSAYFNQPNMLLAANDNAQNNITINANTEGAGAVSNIDVQNGVVTVNVEQSNPSIWDAIAQTFDNKLLIVVGIALIFICASLIYLYSKKNKSAKDN